jgi:hypothetical protein
VVSISWASPDSHVWTAGEVLTASNMNTYVRLNLDFLYGLTYPLGRGRAYLTATPGVTGGANNLVPFDTLSYQTGTPWDLTNHRFVAPVAGDYLATATALLSPGAGQLTRLQANFFVNGAQNAIGTDTQSGAANTGGCHEATIVALNVNDYVDFRVYVTATAATSFVAGSYITWMSVRLLGPSS